MSKDKNFSELMTKPDEDEQGEVWAKVMDIAKMFEEEHGYKRQTILEALLDATLDLAIWRGDERLFAHMNDTRRFYLYASEVTKRRFDQFASYRVQREAEEMYGKDMLHMRDAKSFGWEEDDSLN